MLLLVVADRDLVGVVEEDVGGHQDGIVEEPGSHALAPGHPVPELGHPLEPAERGQAAQEPARLGVGAHVALEEERAALGVEAAGHEQGDQSAGLAAQRLGVPGHRQRVQVDDAEEVLLLGLAVDPALDGPEVVPEMQVARGLDPAEDARLHGAEPQAGQSWSPPSTRRTWPVM